MASSPHFNNAGYGSSMDMDFSPSDPVPIDQGDDEVEANDSSAFGKNGPTKLCVRGHWRAAEDAKLKELVAQFGPRNWNSIAEHLEGRTGKSCRLRWFNQLDPKINRSAFTVEEEERLLAAHKMYGTKWAMISRLFPGRTDNAVKNHWHVMMARRQREQQHRRRKPTFQNPDAKVLNLLLSKNAAASESTISSTIDESASACANLSLTPSSFRSIPRHFHNQNTFQAYGSLMGLSGESSVPVGDVGCDKLFSAWNGSSDRGHVGKLMGVDQSNCSVSNSEVSVSESVATNKTSTSNFGQNEDVGNKINMLFIDFLGVGAT